MPQLELITLLQTPVNAKKVEAAQWNLILVQARQSMLLGQLAAWLQRNEQLDRLLPAVRKHLELELLTARRRGESAIWELGVMRRAIEPEVPVVVSRADHDAINLFHQLLSV